MLRYLKDWVRYRRLAGRERPSFRETHPCLYDRTDATPVDGHYFHQAAWAMRRIAERAPSLHVDVGSHNHWVACMATQVPVKSVDIRPLHLRLEGLECCAGSLLALPFPPESVESISCLHVVEHVGLGRYGDPLEPQGTARACAELARVLAPGGRLYLSLPVGRPRVCFNAHRVTDPSAVADMCAGLRLLEFSVVDDGQRLVEGADPDSYRDAAWACGLYVFARDGRT